MTNLRGAVPLFLALSGGWNFGAAVRVSGASSNPCSSEHPERRRTPVILLQASRFDVGSARLARCSQNITTIFKTFESNESFHAEH